MIATNAEPALVLDTLSKSFGPKTAVNGLSLRVERGEVLAFLGPNGAGKTTTIEMCEGFQKPSSGSIRVLGLDPTRNPDLLRQRIGIMLQGGGSYSGIRVEEMLKLTASYSKDSVDVEWLIELLGLDGLRKTTYRRLSGGQQQRLSLALALVGRPELIFLDEPTAGMDAQSRLVVWRLIEQLKQDGVTVVLTTHLMDEAEALADQVAIIDRGVLVAKGTPEQLRSESGGGGQVSFSTTAHLKLELLPAELAATITQTRPLHYRIQQQATPELLASLMEQARQQNVLVNKLDSTARSLEDVFLDLTGRKLRS
ncbi:ABC transporter ATP-binding protein [Corynebacterium gerontici]|uniref:Daunorubicin/doxorubicin resistance ATP-binding protein DrrA n=1 Tax=Corynebacterium gerontici TaxID=2079234 RepID=A0A3G6J0B0_9CORY|nr:ABC transporter ATP-binding protein [Corynebacterium gerontici]AZA11475.1 Daunorubicin/doxorubicin resistance ATP-binding protein DrrA [Corynebacterium gerontici]